MRPFIIAAIGLWWIGGGVSAAAGEAPVLKTKVKIGERAPEFSLRDRDGNLVRLGDFAFPGKETTRKKKRKVLLDFFATDCKACVAELPQVIAYSEKNKTELQVLLIAIPEKEDGQAKLDKFLKEHPVPFPVLLDAYESVAKKYISDGTTLTLPAIFLLDRNARVQVLFMGLEENLEASLQTALVGSVPPASK